MDVTFLEHQPYYPKADIQGERTEESQLWRFKDIIQTAESAAEPAKNDAGTEVGTLGNNPTIGTDAEAPTCSIEGGPKAVETTTQADKQLLVFSRRKKTRKKPESHTSLQ